MPLTLSDLENAREDMVAEIERDVAAGTLYRSKRLTEEGWAAYPALLLEAAAAGSDATLTAALARPEFWLAEEQSTSSKGKVFSKKVPINAHETLAESEFNRFYLRGLCGAAAKRQVAYVLVYRGKAVAAPRPESEALIGAQLDATTLLNDLRTNIGVDTALGLPPGPNSGLSGRLPD